MLASYSPETEEIRKKASTVAAWLLQYLETATLTVMSLFKPAHIGEVLISEYVRARIYL